MPILFLLGIVRNRDWITLPGPSYILSLLVLYVSLSIGGFMGSGELIPTLMKNTSLVVSFLVGYACLRNCSNESRFFVTLAAVSITYTILCTIAVLKIAPAWFPVKGNINILGGELVQRYEITTDQNFQVLYILGSTTLILAAKRLSHYVALVILTFMNFYVMSELQTRSGFIVLLLAIFLMTLTRLRRLGAARATLYFGGGLAFIITVGVLTSSELSEVFQKIILRFTDSDLHTLSARTEGVQLFLQFLANPKRWIFFEPNYFYDLNGFSPHFSPAVLIMQGGIFAVAGWFYVMPLPIMIVVTRILLRGKGSTLDGVVGITALCALVVYMSAPIYGWDVVWLWGGATVGCLMRARAVESEHLDAIG